MSGSNGKGLLVATRILLVFGMVMQLFIAASYIFGSEGPTNLYLPTFGGRVIGEGLYTMHAEGELSQIPAIDADLGWSNGPDGAVDTSTGLPAVELSGPYTATLNFLNPGSPERVAYVSSRILSPFVATGALLLLYRVVSSVKAGSPFTAANGRRLWWLALVVGLGGTAASVVTSLADQFLISRSAAASIFRPDQISIQLWPMVIGLLLAVLALAWSRGIALEEDVEGLV